MAAISSSSTSATNAAITASGSQISKQNEAVYHQSNLLGTWTGAFKGTKQEVTFKVLKITGNTAEIEYDHNGRVEKGQAQVDKNLITYNDITIGTRDGKRGAIESWPETSNNQGRSPRVPRRQRRTPIRWWGSWSGLTSSGNAASFTVKSVTGDKADITYTVNGITRHGTANYDAKRNRSVIRAQNSWHPQMETPRSYSRRSATHTQ